MSKYKKKHGKNVEKDKDKLKKQAMEKEMEEGKDAPTTHDDVVKEEIIEDVDTGESAPDTVDVDDKSQDDEIQFTSTGHEELRQKNKTLIAIIILLLGFAFGSLFIDIAQLFSGKGFSARALKDAQVVEYDGNTWVRYDDPKIVVDVFDADDCEDCVTEEVLVRLRSLIPTLEAHRIDVRTEEGKQYALENDIKYIPAFIFSEEVTSSDFYQEAAILFKDSSNNKFYFEAAAVGVPIGEYIEEPTTDEGISLGNDNAKVAIVAYTDMSCAMCKTVDPIIEKIREEFKDDIKIIVKLAVDEMQKNATQLAVAAECSHEQSAFDKYKGVLFANQKTLVEAENVDSILVQYATNLKLDTAKFQECIAREDVKEKIENYMTEASRFGIIGTPTLFINGDPHIGVITYDNLKEQVSAIINPTETQEVTQQ